MTGEYGIELTREVEIIEEDWLGGTYVKKKYVEKFSARCRQYMLIYLGIDSGNKTFTYESIERFVDTMKMHQNIGDQEKNSFIKKKLMDSIVFGMKLEEDDIFISVWEDIISTVV